MVDDEENTRDKIVDKIWLDLHLPQKYIVNATLKHFETEQAIAWCLGMRSGKTTMSNYLMRYFTKNYNGNTLVLGLTLHAAKELIADFNHDLNMDFMGQNTFAKKNILSSEFPTFVVIEEAFWSKDSRAAYEKAKELPNKPKILIVGSSGNYLSDWYSSNVAVITQDTHEVNNHFNAIEMKKLIADNPGSEKDFTKMSQKEQALWKGEKIDLVANA